jgi:8-oxo-dGTP diphosphatase
VITVVGEHGGRAVARFVLGHGDDPVAGLAARGWRAGAVRAVGVLGDLALEYDVVPGETGPERPVPQGPGLTAAERAVVSPRQRVAAYAVVVREDRLLLTLLSGRTGAPGRWTLPGGGIDPGEEPVDAVLREVHEETGQTVDEVRLLEVMTAHWVGVSDRGPEDYHAVRLLHRARCTRPTRPVVHDVGGSTADARWVPLGELSGLTLVPTVPVALAAAGVRWAHGGPQS